ncbi:unnamed protein product [Lampetra fluviatilis]
MVSTDRSLEPSSEIDSHAPRSLRCFESFPVGGWVHFDAARRVPRKQRRVSARRLEEEEEKMKNNNTRHRQNIVASKEFNSSFTPINPSVQTFERSCRHPRVRHHRRT